MPRATKAAVVENEEITEEKVEEEPEPEVRNEGTEDRREQRQKEWGTQFDKWLINNAQRKRTLVVTTVDRIFGVTKDGNILEATVSVVDRDFVCFETGDLAKIWLNKSQIASAKQIIGRPGQPVEG